MKVYLKDGSYFEKDYDAGYQMIQGRWTTPFEDEQQLLSTVEWVYGADGNMGCDCNLSICRARFMGAENPFEGKLDCGDALEVQRITLVRPDGTELEADMRPV